MQPCRLAVLFLMLLAAGCTAPRPVEQTEGPESQGLSQRSSQRLAPGWGIVAARRQLPQADTTLEEFVVWTEDRGALSVVQPGDPGLKPGTRVWLVPGQHLRLARNGT